MQHNLPRTIIKANGEVKLTQSAHLLITVYVMNFSTTRHGTVQQTGIHMYTTRHKNITQLE